MIVLETIKNAFAVTSKNLKLWVLLVVISIVLTVISIPLVIAIFGDIALQPGATPSPDQMAKINWALFSLFIILALAVQTFINAGLVGCVRDMLKINILNLGSFLGHAKKFFLRFILFGIIMLLVGGAMAVVLSLLGILVSLMGGAINFLGIIFGIILAIVAIAVFVLLGVYASFVPIVIVANDKGVIESLRATLDFIKRKFWTSTGLVVSLVILFLIVALINNFAAIRGGGIALPVQILTGLVNMYLTILYTVGLMSFYLGDATAKTPVE